MPDPFAPRSMKRKNVKGLALTPAAPKPPPTAETARNDDQSAQLEIGIEYNLDLRPEDIEFIKELGHGNGGTVSKVRHIPTNTTIARKVIHVEAKKEMRKRIVRELQIMRHCHSEYIVTFYGSFLNDNNDVIMCMEYMDVGALDRVSRVFGPVRVDVLGKIAEATLGGLTYLYVKHHIMHRDIKPSNILVNSRGSIKLCDFGVSGELINSIADTFVGTSTYMAPERIQGERYTVKSDVWSFGLSIMELAIGKFPFASNEQQSDDDESAPAGILDLLQQIVHEPAPRLPKSDAFPSILEDMIQKCLYKNPDERPTPQELFERDHFVQAAKRTPVDLREWAVSLMERDNRKSHLAPQLSPATQELLRGTDSPSVHGEDRSMQTPTSGEIPIVGDILSPRDQHGLSVPNRSPTRPASGPGLNIGNAGLGGGYGSGTTAAGSGSAGAGIGIGAPSAGFSSLGRAGGQAVHPGLGARMMTADSIPRAPASMSTSHAAGHGAAHAHSHSHSHSQHSQYGRHGHSQSNGSQSSLGMISTTFSLPVRPAPHPNVSLPPVPPKKDAADDYRRRQLQQLQLQQQQQLQLQQQQQQQRQQQQYHQQPYPSQTPPPPPQSQSQSHSQPQPPPAQQHYQYYTQQPKQQPYPPANDAYPIGYPSK